MNYLEGLNQSIAYIEDNLLDEPDYDQAHRANCRNVQINLPEILSGCCKYDVGYACKKAQTALCIAKADGHGLEDY